MGEFLKRRWAWILAGLLLLVLVIQFGGVTIVVINQSSETICAVHVNTSGSEFDRSPNRLLSRLPRPQSRDIRLPLFLTLFIPADERILYTWAFDCEGTLLAENQFRGGDNLFLWEVNTP
ncbi:MAG: hypothetical protein JXB85_11165 [Anaerolineales bacterium]|nr:hypothetical protein [Anaerolineales bacterium]